MVLNCSYAKLLRENVINYENNIKDYIMRLKDQMSLYSEKLTILETHAILNRKKIDVVSKHYQDTRKIFYYYSSKLVHCINVVNILDNLIKNFEDGSFKYISYNEADFNVIKKVTYNMSRRNSHNYDSDTYALLSVLDEIYSKKVKEERENEEQRASKKSYTRILRRH